MCAALGPQAAVFSFSQFTTSYAWGLWSNVHGRKPVLLIGCVASGASLIWFGASGSFRGAALARVAGGLLNGILGWVGLGPTSRSRASRMCTVLAGGGRGTANVG
jgi:MFS family permease